MIDKTPYTPGMREVLKLSKAEAARLGNDYIGPEHYLLGVIRKGDGLAVQVFINLNVDADKLKFEIERNVERGRGPTGGLFSPNAHARQALEFAKTQANEMKHGWVGTEHLLLAMLLQPESIPGQCLAAFGITYDQALKEVLSVIEGTSPVTPNLNRQKNMDHLHLTGLQFFGLHGTEPWEKEVGRRFEVDVDLQLDMTAAGQTDDLHKALDYRKAYAAAQDVVAGESHELIERIAWRILEEMFKRFPQVKSVRVKVGKPEAPIGGLNRMVTAEILRYRDEYKKNIAS